MNDEALSCPICYSEFDDKESLPRLVPVCGHTICQVCITQLLKTLAPYQNFTCPLDK